MDNRTIESRRLRLLTVVSVLGLACAMLGMSAGGAGAATTHARITSTSARTATALQEVSGKAHPASGRSVNASVRPLTCSPLDLPYRFSSGTWTTYYLEKSANGCQSVWATSGQTFYFEVINVNGAVVAANWCYAGTTCQLWNPAQNYVPFYIWDVTDTTTSVNIYY
jgi:hypothetical protein